LPAIGAPQFLHSCKVSVLGAGAAVSMDRRASPALFFGRTNRPGRLRNGRRDLGSPSVASKNARTLRPNRTNGPEGGSGPRW